MALALHLYGGFSNHDWRPLGLGFGGGSLAALLALTILPLLSRGSPREAYVAYAINQKMPMPVLYGLLTVGVALFCATLSTFFR